MSVITIGISAYLAVLGVLFGAMATPASAIISAAGVAFCGISHHAGSQARKWSWIVAGWSLILSPVFLGLETSLGGLFFIAAVVVALVGYNPPKTTKVEAKKEKIHSWTNADRIAAMSEGWGLFREDEVWSIFYVPGPLGPDGRLTKTNIDPIPKGMNPDDAARAYVFERAKSGSPLHRKALVLCSVFGLVDVARTLNLTVKEVRETAGLVVAR